LPADVQSAVDVLRTAGPAAQSFLDGVARILEREATALATLQREQEAVRKLLQAARRVIPRDGHAEECLRAALARLTQEET
jgi:hypothetical protein